MRILNRLVPVVLLAAVVLFVRAPFMIDGVRYESTMGLIQKIFYFHVPAAITTFVSAFVCGIASVIYLVRRRPARRPRRAGRRGARRGVRPHRARDRPALGAQGLGRLVEWEARLTATLIMWMIFVAYLLLRRFGGAGAEVLAAAVGLFGMALVPFVYWSVNVWRTLHPTTDVVITLPPDMLAVFGWCAVAFLLLYYVLLMLRVRLEISRAALEQAVIALED